MRCMKVKVSLWSQVLGCVLHTRSLNKWRFNILPLLTKSYMFWILKTLHIDDLEEVLSTLEPIIGGGVGSLTWFNFVMGRHHKFVMHRTSNGFWKIKVMALHILVIRQVRYYHMMWIFLFTILDEIEFLVDPLSSFHSCFSLTTSCKLL